MDTPGGLVSAARDIVSAMEEASVPVTVWVGPPGSRAGSAGAYISAAGDALGHGSRHQHRLGDARSAAEARTSTRKVRNDFAASIAALAEEHGRDPTPYRAMVTDVAQPDGRARPCAGRRRHDPADGRGLRRVARRARTLDGGDGRHRGRRRSRSTTLPWYLRVLQVVTDPNLVFLLLILGIAGIGFEVFNPGAIVPGVVGAISLLLALAGLAVLPVHLDRRGPDPARRRPLRRGDPGRRSRRPHGGRGRRARARRRLPLRLERSGADHLPLDRRASSRCSSAAAFVASARLVLRARAPAGHDRRGRRDDRRDRHHPRRRDRPRAARSRSTARSGARGPPTGYRRPAGDADTRR